MSKARAARRLATAAAVGGGGIGLFGGFLYGLLSTQAKLARRKIGNVKDKPLDPSGLYGGDLPDRPLRLAVLGDSAAAGYGASVPAETFGAFLATGLVDVAQVPVILTCVAAIGAQTSALEEQMSRVLPDEPDVCAIIVGGNDVTHKVMPSESVRALRSAVETLRRAGTDVVVGTCPDLGTVRPIAPPLRQVARTWSRRLAAAQAIAVVEAGGRVVSLASILGVEFAAAPSDMFGPDQFHPSPAGYRACAAAMLPSVASAVGVVLGDEQQDDPLRGGGVLSLPRAAALAADSTGSEVSSADLVGVRVQRGRWAVLRHRRRHAIPAVGQVEAALGDIEPTADVPDEPSMSERP